MKNISVLLFFFLFGATTLFSQTPSACKSFHTGTFYDTHAPSVTIVRDEEFQIETDADGKYMKMKITWINDCTYQLTPIKTTKRAYRKSLKKIGVLTVTITSCSEDSYKYSATSAAMTTPMVGTIKRK